MNYMVFFKIINNIINKIKRSLVLNRYDDFTIADYYRDQGAIVGKDCRIEVRDLGPEPYLITVGDHCTIAPGVIFMTHDGATWLFTDNDPSIQKFEKIEIKDNCFIGLNSIILGGVTIGPNAIIGAGSVVTKDIPENAIAAGNPARVISDVQKYKAKVENLWNRIKPPGYFNGIEKEIRYDSKSIHSFKLRDYDLLRSHLIRIRDDK